MAGVPAGRLPLATSQSADSTALLTAATTAASSSALSCAPGSLNFVVVPSGSATVMLDRIASLDANRHDLDPRVAQQGHEMLALGPADGDDRARRQAMGRQRPGHVDALAAGIDPDAQRAHHLPPGERLDLDGPVDARVQGEGDDHAIRTFETPRPELIGDLGIQARVGDQGVDLVQDGEP